MEERHQDQRGQGIRLLALILAIVAVASIGVTGSHFSQPRIGGVWGSFLLGLSTAFCLILAYRAWVHHEGALTGLVLIFGFFESAKIMLTFVYSSIATFTKGAPWSWTSLFFVLLVVLGSILLTSRLLEARAPEETCEVSSRKWAVWIQDLTRVRFLALLSYVFILMYAMYFLSFALAFHDMDPTVRGLYVVPVEGETTPKLALLDYMYFMVYTITTTGYGDLQPASAYTKFLTTIANLFEVYFLVIVGNVLIVFSTSNTSWRHQ